MSPRPLRRHSNSITAAGVAIEQARLRDDWESDGIQRLLADARLRYGNALCGCRPSPLKLQIRLREGKLHLAVWPNEGAEHDTECAFFRDEVLEQHAPARPAPTPASAPTPVIADTPAVRWPLHIGHGEVPDNTELVSIRTLGYRLWDFAALCRWHPTWSRDWGRARYELVRAAEMFTLNGHAAERLLFIPRPYRETQQSSLNAEWERFVRELATRRDGAPHVLIAPVRRITVDEQSGAARAFLRHLRAPIGLHRACADFLYRECRNTMRPQGRLAARAGEPIDPREPEVMGIFSVEGSTRGGVWARAGWLLPVHPTTFIPAASFDVVLLIDKLLAGGYAFQHLLSEQAPSRRTSADWLLRHVLGPDGRPVARASLEILNRGSDAEYLQVRGAIAQRMAEQGIPTWTWTPTGGRATRAVPPLPPTDQTAVQAAQEALRQIALSPTADYQFGPSQKLFSDERKTA